MVKTRGDLADDVHLQLLGAERRFNVDAHRIGGRAEQVGVIVARAQRGREQHAAARRAQARADERGRHHVAQAKLRQWTLAVEVAFADIEQVMLVVQLGDPGELQQVEIEILQAAVEALRMFVEVIADGRTTQGDGLQEFVRRLVVGLIRRQLRRVQRVPFAIDPLQRILQRGRRGFAHAGEGELVEAGAVHLPAALDQVVRLVGEHRDFPLIELGQTEQQRAEVEVIVVVGNHHIRPAGHFLTQVVRAHAVLRGDFTHRRLIEQVDAAGGSAGGRQAIIKTLGQRAGFAMTGLVRMFAGLVAGNHFHHPQRQVRRLPEQHLAGIQRQLASGSLGGEKEHLVQLLRRQGLEHRKQRAKGFADAGRRLGHEAAAGADGFEH